MLFASIFTFSIIISLKSFSFLFTSKSLQNLFTQIKSYNLKLLFEVLSSTLNRQKKTSQASRKKNINIISATIYYYLIIKHAKNKNYKFFVMFLNDINKIFNYIESRIKIKLIFEINEIFIQKITLN